MVKYKNWNMAWNTQLSLKEAESPEENVTHYEE